MTDDAEGEVLTSASADQLQAISDDMIKVELAKMKGVIQQRPSSVSAVKVDGQRAHARVRAGEDVQLPAREVTISQLHIGEIRRTATTIEIDIEVTCSAGTFIRAIARDCGSALGVGGHLSALRRTRVASFGLAPSVTIDQLKSGEFEGLSIAEVAALTFPIRNISEDEVLELSFGRTLTLSDSAAITAAMAHGQLIALLSNKESHAKPIAVFAAAS